MTTPASLQEMNALLSTMGIPPDLTPLKDANGWIKVSDALPPEPVDFQYVKVQLFWDKGLGVETGWYTGDRQFQRANGDMDYHDEMRVTHWKPEPVGPVSESTPAVELPSAWRFAAAQAIREAFEARGLPFSGPTAEDQYFVIASDVLAKMRAAAPPPV